MKKKNKTYCPKHSRIIALVLTVVFCAAMIPLGIHVFATDGNDYDNAVLITFSNGTHTITQSDIDSGVVEGALCKYEYNGKTYVFDIDGFSPSVGDTFTLNTAVSPFEVEMFHDPIKPVGDEVLEKLTDHLQDNGNGTFIIDSTNQNHFLDAGITYWYKDPSTQTVYKFTPTEDYGYESIESRENDVYIVANNGTINLTLNRDESTVDFDGIQWRRRIIYERATTLQEDHVFLIVGVDNGQRYMYRYSNDTTEQNGCYDQDVIPSATGCCSWNTKREDVYGTATNYYNVSSELIYASPSGGESALYDSIGAERPSVHNNYFDGYDGTIYQGEGDLVYDPYVYSEFSSYLKNVGLGSTLYNWIHDGSVGYPLRGFDGDGSAGAKGYYTNNKAFGAYFNEHRDIQAQVFVKFFCTGYTGLTRAHFNGMTWNYSEGKMYNNNTISGIYDPFKYLNFTSSSRRIRKTMFDTTYTGFFCGPEYNSGEIEIYEMKNVYNKDVVDDTYNLTVDKEKTKTVNSLPLENATVILNYDGGNKATKGFDISIKLIDENNAPVSGTYPGTLKGNTYNFVFEDGVCSEDITLKDSQTVVITNIPYNYSFAVEIDEDQTDDLETTITEKEAGGSSTGTEIQNGQFVNLTTDKEIDIGIHQASWNAKIVLNYPGDTSNRSFKTLFRIKDEEGNILSDYTNMVYAYSNSSTGYSSDIPLENGTFTRYMTNDTYQSSDTNEFVSKYIWIDNVPDGAFIEIAIEATQAENDSPYFYSFVMNDGDNNVEVKQGTHGSATGLVEMDKNRDGTTTPITINVSYDRSSVAIWDYTKDTKGNTIEKDTSFAMKLTLSKEGSSFASETVDIPGIGIDDTVTTFSFVNGECNVSLKDNEGVLITMPVGYTLTVTDAADPSPFTTEYKYKNNENNQWSDISGTITTRSTQNNPNDVSDILNIFHIKDIRHDVTIREQTTGLYANTQMAFPIDLTLIDSDNVGITADVEITGDITGTLHFVNGSMDDTSKELLKLAHDQSVTLKDIPDGALLTVVPSSNDYYTSTVLNTSDESSNSGRTGVINDDGITFSIIYNRNEVTDSGIIDSPSNTISLLIPILAALLAALVGYGGKRKERKG